MNPKKLSIIIPVYNTEKYLKECLDSIVNQSFKDYECLLIDDGSTDSSGIICDEYANKDKRFKVFHVKNGGVSKARNIGIKNANGDYITFVDSDDWIDSDSYQCCFAYMENKENELLCFGMKRVTEDKQEKKIEFKDLGIYENFIRYPIYMNSLCNKILKRNIVIKNNLYLDENISVCEDLLFIFQFIFLCNKRIKYINKNFYSYRVNNSSATMLKLSEKKLTDTFLVYKTLSEFCRDHKLLQEANRFLKYRNLCYSIQFLINIDFFDINKYRKENIKFNIWTYSKRIDYFLLTFAADCHLDLIPKIYNFIKRNK